MKKVFLNLSLLSPVMESSPVFSNWSSIFDYKFIYMGRMGVTLNTAHDTAQLKINSVIQKIQIEFTRGACSHHYHYQSLHRG